MQALRSVEPYLNLEKLYVLGTNCVDNGPPEGLATFLNAASKDPDTVLHYEFMQVTCLRPCSLCSTGNCHLPSFTRCPQCCVLELSAQAVHSPHGHFHSSAVLPVLSLFSLSLLCWHCELADFKHPMDCMRLL